MPRIEAVTAELFTLPLSEVLSDATQGDHTHFELVIAQIRLDSGVTGSAAHPRGAPMSARRRHHRLQIEDRQQNRQHHDQNKAADDHH